MNSFLRKRNWGIGLGALIVVAIGIVAVAVWPEPKEPEYQGRQLSEWLEMQWEHPGETAEAVRAIGPEKAVPFLVRWVDFRYPEWKRRLLQFFIDHHHLPGSSHVRRHRDRSTDRAMDAFRGFVILGERASNAVPALEKMACDPSSVYPSFAIGSLSYLGDGAMGPLIKMCDDPTLPSRRRAMAATAMRNFTYLGQNASRCIDALATCAVGRDPMVASSAKVSLGIFTEPEGLPVPNVNWTNAAPNPLLRRWAMRATISFATNSEPFIYEFISQPSPGI